MSFLSIKSNFFMIDASLWVIRTGPCAWHWSYMAYGKAYVPACKVPVQSTTKCRVTPQRCKKWRVFRMEDRGKFSWHPAHGTPRQYLYGLPEYAIISLGTKSKLHRETHLNTPQWPLFQKIFKVQKVNREKCGKWVFDPRAARFTPGPLY